MPITAATLRDEPDHDEQLQGEDDLDQTLQQLFDSPANSSDEDEARARDSSKLHNCGLERASKEAQAKSCSLTNRFNAARSDADSVLDGEERASGATDSGPGALPDRTTCGKASAKSFTPSGKDSRKRKVPMDPELKVRSAFQVVGNAESAQKETGYSITEKNVSNMVIRCSSLSPERLSALFELSERIDIAEIASRFDDIRGGRTTNWVLFGCLVKKHAKRETKQGSKFAVWSLYNMPRWSVNRLNSVPPCTMVTLLVCDDAFSKLHTMVEGSAIAVRRAKILPPRESEMGKRSERGGPQWCGYCITISKREQLVALGICQDYHLCIESNGQLGQCGLWFDANRLDMCTQHTSRKRMRMLRGTRMDVNNAERPLGRCEGGMNNDGRVCDISLAPNNGGLNWGLKKGVTEEQRRRLMLDRRKAVDLMKRAERARTGAKGSEIGLEQIGKQGVGKVSTDVLKRATSRGVTIVRGIEMEREMKKQKQGKVEKEVCQRRYDEAMRTLIGIGYEVNEQGDLKAPLDGGNVRLWKKKEHVSLSQTGHGKSGTIEQSVRQVESNDGCNANEKDVYLSDESM